MAERTFVARQAQLAQLRTWLDRALAGHGQVAFVVGEAGAGKTTLIAEFASRAEEAHQDLVFAMGTCDAQTGTGDPYLPFREILDQLTGDAEGKLAKGAVTSQNARRLGAMAHLSIQTLVEFGPDLINILVPGSSLVAKAGKYVAQEVGWLDKLKKPADKGAVLPTASTLDQNRIFEQYTNVLNTLALQRPLVLVLDDLQWADAASTSLLFHLGRRIQGSSILVLGAYRPEEVDLGRGDERHPLEKVLAEFKRYFGDVWMDLDGAEKGEARQFVDGLVDLEPNCLGEAFREALVRHTGGHPLFAVELLQTLRERGDLEKDAEGRWIEGMRLDWEALPPRVEGVIEERIGRLEEDLRETLRVGSVEGLTFTAEVVARVQRAEERALVRRLSSELDKRHHLVALQGVRRRGPQALSSYQFRHNLFQKYVYGSLDAAERTYLHADVASALEALYGEEAEQNAVQLAYHWEQAEYAEKAIPHLLRAGDGARLACAHQEAIDFYERAQTMLQKLGGGPVEQRLTAEEGLGDVRAVLGEHDAALAHYERARELVQSMAGASERLAGLCRKTAMLFERKGQYATALQWLERGLSSAGSGRTMETARIRLAEAGVHSRQGQHRQALESCQQGLEIARQLNAAAELAHGTYLLGTIHGHLGHSADEIACARSSLTLYEGLGDLLGQANALNNLGVALWEGGDWAGATESFQRALELDARLGQVHDVAKVTNNLGNVLFQRGRLDEAAQAYRKCLELWTAIDFPLGVALSLSNLGEVGAEGGDWEIALDNLQRSERLFQQIQSRHFLPEVYRRQAVVYLGCGQADEAQLKAESSVSLASELDMELERALSLRVLGQVLLALGQWAPAEQALSNSLKVLEGQGNRFGVAQTLVELGRLWRVQALGGDTVAAEKARVALERARAMFAELGAERELAKLQEAMT
jgi:predicted ATPase